jgi:hypothetical protein
MFMVAALASSAAFAFGQSSLGQTPPYALAAMLSTQPTVVSGSLPDANTLVKIGLNEDQANAVIGIWGQARQAVAPERAQLRQLDASHEQPAADSNTADTTVTTRATLEGEISGKLSTYKDQIHALIGSDEFSKISPFLGNRHAVSAGNWGQEKDPSIEG